MSDVAVHPFERAGLGKAPFHFAGLIDQQVNAGGERVLGETGGCTMTTHVGGSCDYCGTYIVEMYKVRSADGKTFKVGSDCIMKVGDAVLTKPVKDDLKRRRLAREQKRIIAARTLYPTLPTLRLVPHPNDSIAKRGGTMFDYIDFLLKSGGRTGKLKAARMVEKAAELWDRPLPTPDAPPASVPTDLAAKRSEAARKAVATRKARDAEALKMQGGV
jgi:hypothetical protein